jgi:uncharacterized alpha-E superfamily protein
MSDDIIARHGTHLIARHAESMLWLARYMERIECTARLLDVTNTFARDEDDTRNWLSILRINGDQGAFYAHHTEANLANVAHFYLLDRDNPTSVQAAMAYARENARTLRAIISTEMWLQVNVFHTRIRGLTAADLTADHFTGVCAMLKEGTQAHTGITEGTLYRDQAWHFYMLGRYLERADQTTRLLDTRFNAIAPQLDAGDGAIDAGQWNTLLRAVAGYHAYRRVHPSGYRPREVAGFLLVNSAFPRSVGLNLAQLEWHLSQLRARYGLRGGMAALERVDHLNSTLTQPAVDALVDRRLSPFLDWLQREIAGVHTDIVTGFCGARS